MSNEHKKYDLFKGYANSISYTKTNLLDTDDELWESNYSPYMVNKIFSMYKDTILYANEMNKLPHLDNKMQYDYLLNIIRSKKRFTSWPKKTQHKDFELVKEYYSYSDKKTEDIIGILTESQINYIKDIMYKGD
jgi:hypothetical protein